MLGAACSAPSAPNPPAADVTLPRSLSSNEQALVAAGNSFAPALFAAVNKTLRSDNVFISPLSASMALGMTLNGTDGTTFTEMRSTLGFGSMDRASIMQSYRDLIALLRALDPKVDFRIANSIWYNDTFASAIAPAFLNEAKQYFDAGGTGLSFGSPAAVTTINDWVKTASNGKITNILNQTQASDVMYLINAIYFKGDWRQIFDTTKTTNGAFTPLTGSAIDVPFMKRSGKMRVGSLGGRTMIELGYGGDAFVMDVVLPNAGESINDLVESLTLPAWVAGTASLAERDVDLRMPRFKMEFEKELNTELKAMGMPTAFVDGLADFTRLSPTRGRSLFISMVKQKTFVDVNETGTVAAAVTVVGIVASSAGFRLQVDINRPFLFVIRERLTGTILFMGKVVRPVA